MTVARHTGCCKDDVLPFLQSVSRAIVRMELQFAFCLKVHECVSMCCSNMKTRSIE